MWITSSGAGTFRRKPITAPGATSSTGSGARTWAASGIPSSLDTFGIELAGGYTVSEGFLRRVTLSYGYITTDRNADVIAKSAMDFMRHKAALAVEVHFLRRMSLALTGSVYDRNGSYTHYPEPGNASLNEERDYKPYFLLDGRLQWEKGICRLYVDATNITDTRYCDIGGIRLPGFWCTGGVTLTIGK